MLLHPIASSWISGSHPESLGARGGADGQGATPAIATNAPPNRLASYALIVGRGRSGTNFLLSLLDHSPMSYSRNEPNELDHSAFVNLPRPWYVDDDRVMTREWDRAVARAAFCMGERDHRAPGEKDFLRPLPRTLGLYRAVQGPRLRHLLSAMVPSIRGAEWPMPRWVGDYRKIADALPVLKLGPVPGWMEWVLQSRPEARVLHIARHPGGFLNSWRNRWLLRNDRQEVRRLNARRLKEIAAHRPPWLRRFGDIDAMSVEESELWFWTYTNQVIYNAGRDRDNYKLVIYEQLASRTIEVTREAYAFCGLPWTDEIEAAVKADSTESLSISNTWQSKLSREHIDLVNRILAESNMSEWWQ